MTARCTGHCCRRFPLPQSLAVLRLRAAGQPDSIQDMPFIADMLIPLGEGTYGDGTPRLTAVYRLTWCSCGHAEQLRSCRETVPDEPSYVVADWSNTAPRAFPPIPTRQRDLVAELESEMANKPK